MRADDVLQTRKSPEGRHVGGVAYALNPAVNEYFLGGRGDGVNRCMRESPSTSGMAPTEFRASARTNHEAARLFSLSRPGKDKDESSVSLIAAV